MEENRKDLKAAVLFVLLALVLSSCYWLMSIFYPKGTLPVFVEQILWGIFRGFGPALAAVVISFYSGGATRFRELISSVSRWRVSWKLYALAFGWPILMVAIATCSAIFFAKVSLKPVGSFAPRLAVMFFAMAILDGPLGEEVGWRGFLLPQLLRKWGPITASLAVGFIWYLWHIPLYAADGKGFALPFLISCLCYSFVFTWLFLKSGRSTFLIIILHNATNYFVYIKRLFFPQIQNSAAGSYVFLALALVSAIAAAVALRRGPLEPSIVLAAI